MHRCIAPELLRNSALPRQSLFVLVALGSRVVEALSTRQRLETLLLFGISILSEGRLFGVVGAPLCPSSATATVTARTVVSVYISYISIVRPRTGASDRPLGCAPSTLSITYPALGIGFLGYVRLPRTRLVRSV